MRAFASALEALFRCAPIIFIGSWLEGLPLRASNEGSPRPRVARAQETVRLPSPLFILNRTFYLYPSPFVPPPNPPQFPPKPPCPVPQYSPF